MAFVRQEFREVRKIDISGGFSNDPDWVGDFDASGARAVGAYTLVPTRTGVIELVYSFENASGDPVAPETNTRLDMFIVMLGSGSEAGVPSGAIYQVERCNNIDAHDVCFSDNALGGPTYIVIRASQLQSPPAGVKYLKIAARVG